MKGEMLPQFLIEQHRTMSDDEDAGNFDVVLPRSCS
jgi:hypothetical protein